MNDESNFFVYRPVLPDSAKRLELLQNEYASIQSFTPVQNPFLTILSGHSKRRLSNHKLEGILDKAPKSSRQAYDTEIIETKIEHLTQDLTRLAMRLVLTSDSTYYQEEHEILRDAAIRCDSGMEVRRFTNPYVTVGYVDTGDGLASLMDSANTLVGSTLRFGSIESNVGAVHEEPVVPRRGARPSTPKGDNTNVRTIRPGASPQGLLASMRRRDVDE